jgi:hypothetical protein
VHKIIVCLTLVGVGAASALAQPPPGPPQPPCDPNDAGLICLGGQTGPEDLVVVPGGEWVVASSLSGEGGFALIRARDRAVTKAYPAATAREQLDRDAFPDCPGPPRGEFTTHGLYVGPEGGPVHRLLVVGHGARESIEVFDIDTSTAQPQVTWVGCAIAPEPIGLNSVRALADGGFLATNFLARGVDPDAMQRMRDGEVNGELWEWHAERGWEKVPGSETAGANGIELSPDERTIYMAAWGTQSFIRMSRGPGEVRRDEVSLGFRVDNIHWARDGSLLATGQVTDPAARQWLVVKIDPATLDVREVLRRPDTPEFNGGTVVAEVGDDWWVGSFRGDRIAVLRAP